MSNATNHNDRLQSIASSQKQKSIDPADVDQNDLQLLQQFVQGHDPQAMEAIIARHGSLVMGVCRRVLRNEHDAADAFQATFLVLLKKAGSLGRFTSLAGWLYGVAHRVACKSRSQSMTRQKREGTGLEMTPTAPPVEPIDEETVARIHEELCQLPENFRLPLILCCLEGETREVAAQHLGWTLGSLKGRLERGREMLVARLRRRGIVLPATVIAAVLAPPAVSQVPAALVGSTVSALTLVAAGQVATGVAVSAQAVALTNWVLKGMIMAKLKISGLILAAGIVAASGSVVVVRQVLSGSPAAQKSAQATEADIGKEENREKQVAQVAAKESEPKTDEADPETEARLKLRKQSMNQLKNFGMAFHNYNAAQGTFPAAASYSSDGKPLLSWRVHLLPYVDQIDLYKKFKLDEPWDSPHNKPLLAKMPDIYRALGMEKEHPQETFYQVFSGKGTAFDGAKGLRLDEFTDGLQWIILVAEAGKPVPWTKPEDISFDADKPLPKLGGVFKDGFCAMMGDGSARFVPRDIPDTQLRPYLTPKAGDAASPF